MMDTTLPDKLYFKIGEVAAFAGVKPSVLRFWETEFVFLRPEKSTTGQRLYSRREVELVLLVKRLLYDERFTIEGVKQKISAKGKIKGMAEQLSASQHTETPASHLELLRSVKQSLQTLRGRL